MRGSASSLDRPSTLPITRFCEGHSPPFRDVLASCVVLSWLSAWVLRRYGWKVGSSLVFGVLIVGLVSLETFLIDDQLWSSKGAPFVRFSPSSSILISSSLRLNTTTLPASSYTLSVMSQQPRPAPYQRRPVPYPPPYERVASHPYGLRPRVTPIRSYGPVPRPTPVRPANNIPTWFCPTRRGVHAVIRNVPFLSDSVRPVPSMPATSCSCSTVVDSMPSPVSNSFRFGGLYNPNARDTPMYPPSPVFDRVIRHPSPFPFPPDWSVFFRDAESSQGSSAGRRMDLDIPLVDRIGPQASGSSDVSLRANSAIVVPPAPRPRNMSTPPSSPRNPPGYVPSPRAATWGQRRRSESSTPGPGPTSARDSLAASVAEHAEIVTYHTLDVDQIHMLLEQPEGLNPYDRHVFSNRVPKDKYRFAVVRFIRLCHDHPTTNQAERDGRVAFFESLRYLAP
ncbi:hypothetical protein PSTT_16421 [Puccinia striiformis]|uniref:Uncharacterized protein n=1 Tax=Puccinia striiformis TaxID=27350 RepID=A0A2S4UDA5_9BASI|nr:hypothetical protein PSTT_16421 [Puccinia striiformis]